MILRTTTIVPTLSLLVLGSLALPSLAQEIIAESAKLTAFDGETHDYFGQGLAVQGDLIAAGAPDNFLAGDHGGAIYLFRHQAGDWLFQEKLTAGPGSYGLGCDVVLDGNQLAGGSATRGAYVFVDGPSGWQYEANIPRPSYLSITDRFGEEIALENDLLVICASAADVHGADSGFAELYERVGSTWTLRQELLPNDAGPGLRFGYDVDMQAGTIVISATDWGSGAGAVYVFRESGGQWQQVQRVLSPVSHSDYAFGFEVALDAGRLVVGEPGYEFQARKGGAAHVFVDMPGGFAHEATLLAPDTVRFDLLGSRVDLHGERAVVTDVNHDFVYLWERNATNWTNTKRFLRAEINGYAFGQGVALGQDFLAVNDQVDSTRTHQAGAVFVFDLAQSQIGQAFCHGDGTSGPCPCGNETLPGSFAGCASSEGEGGTLVAAGSTSVSQNDLLIGASLKPGNKNALLFYSHAQGPPIFAGNGLTCLGGGAGRTYLRPGYQHHWGPGLVQSYGWVAGDELVFQCLYRDSLNSCGAFFNVTNALTVTLVP